VPGTVFGARHRGSHALLRDGARLVESAASVLDELGWGTRSNGAAPATGDPLLSQLPPGEDCDVDTLAGRAGCSVPEVLRRLLRLELAGAVRRAPGGRFVRVVR
jgi:DNA processing protein